MTHHHVLEGFGDDEGHAPVTENHRRSSKPSHSDGNDLRHDQPRDGTPADGKAWKPHALPTLSFTSSCWREPELTCDEDGHAGQSQPGEVSVGRRHSAGNFGRQVEVDAKRRGADHHGHAWIQSEQVKFSRAVNVSTCN